MGIVFTQRKHNRLKGFNYSTSGWYFVTTCTKNRIEYFGDVVNRKMVLNDYGRIIHKFWQEIPTHFQNASIDENIIMPNHIHGIIVIKQKQHVGAIFKSSQMTGEINFAPTMGKPTLSRIIKWVKSISTIEIRKINNSFHWQKSFYDHIIRNERSLWAIREYIRNNPLKWNEDRNNVENLYM